MRQMRGKRAAAVTAAPRMRYAVAVATSQRATQASMPSAR